MINKLKILLFLLIPIIPTAPHVYAYEAQLKQSIDTLATTSSNKEINPLARKWELSVYGGYSYRLGEISELVPVDLVDYVNQLRSGYHVGGKLGYFWQEAMGVGLQYTTFDAKGWIDNIKDPNYKAVNGRRRRVSDNTVIHSMEAFYSYRLFFANRRAAVDLTYGLGYTVF